MVFASKSRIDWRINQYSESPYQFWDRCSWPLIGMLRDHINQWATDMPVDNELFGRLRSRKDPRHFASGIFELVFFTCCKQAGLPIERITARAEKTTDYTIKTDLFHPIFLECALVANAMENYEERRRRAYVTQLIEEMTDFPYCVAVQFEQIGTSTIRKKALRKAFEDFVTNNPAIEGTQLEFPDKDWKLTFYFHHKTQISDRTFAAESGFAKEIDNSKPILAALNDKKPKSYQLGDSPYVICLAIDDISADLEEFAMALIGFSHNERINLNYRPAAFFYYRTKPINTSVSAVIFCRNIHPTSFLETHISVWHNPFATQPISHDLFSFEQYYYEQKGHYLYSHTIPGSFNVFATLKVDRERYIEYLQLKHRKAPDQG